MNYVNNSTFEKSLKGIIIGTAIATQVSAGTEIVSLSQYSFGSTKQTVYYSPTARSSVQSTPLFQNHYVVIEYEKSIIFQEIKKKFNFDVTKHWIPNNTFNEKTCLFIQVNDQDKLSLEAFDSLEESLYAKLKDTLSSTQNFNMIALL